jgi:hypothetical protein
MMVINVLMALYVWSRRSEVDPKPEADVDMRTAEQPAMAG